MTRKVIEESKQRSFLEICQEIVAEDEKMVEVSAIVYIPVEVSTLVRAKELKEDSEKVAAKLVEVSKEYVPLFPEKERRIDLFTTEINDVKSSISELEKRYY